VEISEWRHIDWELDQEDEDLSLSFMGENIGLFKLFDWEL
jgi:hypothetical protein